MFGGVKIEFHVLTQHKMKVSGQLQTKDCFTPGKRALSTH